MRAIHNEQSSCASKKVANLIAYKIFQRLWVIGHIFLEELCTILENRLFSIVGSKQAVSKLFNQ